MIKTKEGQQLASESMVLRSITDKQGKLVSKAIKDIAKVAGI